MRKIVFILLVFVFIAGCTRGSFPDVLPKQINITWQIVPTEVVQALSEDGGIIMSDKRYYAYTPGSGGSSVVIIEADLDGDTSKDFEFKTTSVNQIEKVANNKAVLTPSEAEKGSLVVSTEGIETLVSFEVFPTMSLGLNIAEPHLPSGFDFATNTKVQRKADIYWQEWKVHANVAIIKKQSMDFFEEFANLNNLHELDYAEQEFIPDFNHLYAIKCKDGYAVINLQTSSGLSFSCIYKYSETGIFE